ncbi:MAG: hypothetical protein K6B44_02460, partial [Lachnospiraceae bacterium]|nr:hypothetical protein [Lachnospiraceae bacterium]
MLMSLLLTGCKSILVSGDLSFQANEPVSPMGAAEGIHEVLLETVDFAKYDIDGESAFWMMPGHLNPVYLGFDMEKETDDIMLADFKAIGYSEIKNRFVYAYLTPIFSSKEYPIKNLTGLTVPKTGNAGEYTIPDPPANLSAQSPYVMVLMSYEPATKDYNVFFCKYISYVYYSEKQPVLMAGKVAGSDLYYIFDPTTMTVEIYDIDGNMRSGRSYMPEIMSAIKEVLNIPTRWNIWRLWLYNWYHWRYSITDVQVDDEMSVYLNVQVEVSEKPFNDESMKHLLDENDDNYDDDQSTEDYDQSNNVVYYNAAVATYSLNLGGENPTIKFTSNIKDDVKTFCEESTKLAPVYIDLTDDIIEEAKKKYIESLGEGADENTKVPDNVILEYAKSTSGYNSLISSGVQKNESSLYDEYYKKVKDALSDGYHEFDTSDMVDQGINLYYALAGIPDLKNMRIKTPDCGENESEEVKDPRSNCEFIYDSLDETYEHGTYGLGGNTTQTALSREYTLVASFLASRTFGPKKGKDIPDWMLEY